MKRIMYLITVILFASVMAFAQQPDAVIVIDKLSAEGILLDSSWKFHEGDNPGWALPEFDDSDWKDITPGTDLYSLSEAKSTIGWIRLKVKPGDAIRGKPLSLHVSQAGASEIFLNGKPVYTFGKVSTDAAQEVTYNPDGTPIPIQFDKTSNIQVLAVRYSTHSPDIYYKNTLLPLFSAQLYLPQDSTEKHKTSIALEINEAMVMGVFFILSALHFFLYLSHRKKNINLYFSIYTFIQALTHLNGTLSFTACSITSRFILITLFFIAAPLAFVFYLHAVYAYFEKNKKLWFHILCIGCILVSLVQFVPDRNIKFYSLYGVTLLIFMEITRISFLGLRKQIQGAKLIFTGQLITMSCFAIYITLNTFYSGYGGLAFRIVVFDCIFLIPPLLLSYILSTDFGATNKLLLQQLKNIEELSSRNLKHEQEKQQILENQNEILEQQVGQRTAELKDSLESLRQAQNQLIQSEKMASLGELTAGIAHEIQNPLNFVNNFSDVSVELLQELKEEADKGDLEEVKALADDVSQNLEKIAHHGRRAEGIIKGMLQHSRSSSGQKEPTDINVLADEYLRLAYHGLKAKDKSFNVELIRHFDQDLPKIAIIPQDIGRVLLNLLTNAFYATQQKSKQLPGYEPKVEISTCRKDNAIEISVKDNGTGIPDAIKDKILQPFFTTKPTGEGTGLGLSLSYDIVVKGHNGSISLSNEEKPGTTFNIVLPL